MTYKQQRSLLTQYGTTRDALKLAISEIGTLPDSGYHQMCLDQLHCIYKGVKLEQHALVYEPIEAENN